jgi:hypothetical protein
MTVPCRDRQAEGASFEWALPLVCELDELVGRGRRLGELI